MVIGGGLGVMSASTTVVKNGVSVVVLDTSSFCGSSNTKASSDISGAGTKTLKTKVILENADIFTADTLKGGAKKPELANLFCVNSAANIDWLNEKSKLDLSLVACLGGRSQSCSQLGAESFLGMIAPYALIQMVEMVAGRTDLARIIIKAYKQVSEGGRCMGCVYEKGNQNFQDYGLMILATGGFGADFTTGSASSGSHATAHHSRRALE
ncbi:unnamed protein product [Polarella glacialis]|uniref:FAD-dependent oxidoreductase 2 FAD-binding domain-containing protein n=1 Tax=Polarella glacialis TaxID=89957 RepID=A0A813LW87_POLGL|nr:unnamed protein product [Polarella glacialis]